VEVLTSKKEPVKEASTDENGAYSVDGLKGGLYILRCNTKETGYINVLSGKIVDADISVPFAVVEKVILTAEETDEETKSDYTMIGLYGDSKSGTVLQPYKTFSIHAPQGPACGEESELLMLWDVSKIPDNAIIISATMEFVVDYHLLGDCKIEWHKMKRKWAVSANWEKADNSTSWSTPGAKGPGDIEPKAEAVQIVKPNPKERVTFDLTKTVQAWVKKKDANYGMRSVSEGTASVVKFVDVLN